MEHPETSQKHPRLQNYPKPPAKKSTSKNTKSVVPPVGLSLVTQFKSPSTSMKIYTISMTLLELEHFDFLPTRFATSFQKNWHSE